MVFLPAGPVLLGSRDPGGAPVHETNLPALGIGRREVTSGEFARFLNATTGHGIQQHPQFERAGDVWRAKVPCQPVSHVSFADAEAFCRWLAAETGQSVRLPSEDEWEAAARGGLRGAPYPWGWEEPSGRAQFNATAAARVGSFPANRYGLVDVAGNLAEWCRGSDTNSEAIARGGSFSERSPWRVAVWSRARFPVDYRDADVGFRVCVGP